MATAPHTEGPIGSNRSPKGEAEAERLLLDLARQRTLREGNFEAASRQITTTATRTLDVELAAVWFYRSSRSVLENIDLYDRRDRTYSNGATVEAASFPRYFSALEDERVIATSDVLSDPRTSELTAAYWAPFRVSSTLDAPIRWNHPQKGLLPPEAFIPVAMQRTEWTMETLREVKALGVHLAIDDFGTGYSSLGYLKEFPIDCIKIDRSFVEHIDTDESDAAIVAAIIAVARALRLRTIAEEVETEHQKSFLLERGCEEMQGYLLSCPMEATAAAEFLRERMSR